MLCKVCSGGQTGADESGLRAAKACGLETGGFIPKGCITLDGPKPELLALYNMQEHTSAAYPPRTEANVKNSDGTLRFASDFKSAGERCTYKAIKWFNRPYFDIDINDPPSKEDVLDWIAENNIQVLNIAGNSEQTSPGIGNFVYNYLVEVFSARTNLTV